MSLDKDLVLVRVPNLSAQVVYHKVCDTEGASAVVDSPCRTLVDSEDHFEVQFTTLISGTGRIEL